MLMQMQMSSEGRGCLEQNGGRGTAVTSAIRQHDVVASHGRQCYQCLSKASLLES